ncbi:MULTISPECIES: TniQ family protein [Alphaproteobacteria]|uniref:TniQ family protein n=1 Tax=Skermanella cutis TaxID=2775420 RepID=A0ABX7BID8_9PROT|nr:hypothetical protein [Aminobacter sp. MDW-2]QNH37976.1 TniQ family protein [Aminobacter sp. MDW-2]QOF74925.1 TniQ family protein [Aminobacter sp. SR38]QQP93890.1 TniQ family protein [Skermanella sp. TT6]
MEPDRLPVAPRPFRDELLSSWMARVACRYGLTAQQLAGYFSGLSSPLPIDDGAPAAGQTRVWAQICSVDPDRLHRLSLSWRYPRRARAWYVSRGPEWTPSAMSGSIPVCLACFAADRAAGHDAHLRAGWMLAERCICPTHGELLHDHCVSCHWRLSVAFHLHDGSARPVCSHCARLLTDRGGRAVSHRIPPSWRRRWPPSSGSRQASTVKIPRATGSRRRSQCSGRRSTIRQQRGRCWRCGSTKPAGAVPMKPGMPSAPKLRSASCRCAGAS